VRSATATVPARAALAGNPSDGYGGRTLAVCLPGLAATATVTDGGEGNGGAAAPLARAALDRIRRLAGAGDRRLGVHVATSIPRQVGLAGSSAIVLAVMRAAARVLEVEPAPIVLAHAALAAEVEDLGIAAGPQDRIVQALGGLVAMDFGADRHERLDPALLPPLFVAHRAAGGIPSGAVHGDLRARWAAGDPAVVSGMRELAALGARARDALVAGDHAAFAACVDGSFDLRRSLVELDAVDAELVAIARRHGASANYAGSGGAVVGVLDAAADLDALEAAYAGAGARLVVPEF
jgi:glucuronokinase